MARNKELFDWKHLGDYEVRLRFYECSHGVALEDLYQAFAARFREEQESKQEDEPVLSPMERYQP